MDRTTCFQCGNDLPKGDGLLVAAGVCEKCFGAALLFGDSRISDFLESLEGAAIMVARGRTVLFSNGQFCRLVGKQSAEVDGKKIGEVLRCMYAETLGACDESNACFMCDLRRFIGLSVVGGVNLPETRIAFQHESGGRRTFKIAVKEFNGVALLNIENAGTAQANRAMERE